MGRAKPKMELISKEKSRNLTFKKRKEGLIRKLYEFTTLCDVSACMIIYGPRQEKGAVEPEIWPQNIDEINRMIGIYKARNKDSGSKTFGLSDFFHDRKRKIEEELAKLRKKNMEAKYPTWLELLNFMTETQLRDFSALLSNKAEYVKYRIGLLKRNKQGFNANLMDFAHARLSQSHSFYSPGMRVINHEQAISHVPIHYPTIDHHQDLHVPIHFPTIDHHQDLHSMSQNNSIMTLLMNDNDQFVQFGSASTSGNIQSASSFKSQVFYESMVGHYGVVDPMICHNAKPLAHYYMPPVPPPPYMQCITMPGAAPPQLQLSIMENHDGGQKDLVQHHMNSNIASYYD